MERERWKHVDRISAAALALAPDERAALLDRECGGDAELRREVEAIVSHSQSGSFLERPAAAEAAKLVVAMAGEPVAGQAVGPYEVVRPLGAGGMGVVYLARDGRLDRLVALKLLPAHVAADDERARRFRREALAASALNHPNIVTVYEVGEWNGRDYIATEFVDGVTLRARLRGRRPLPLAASIDIALQCASALAAAHRSGIVHRDVKPENIMVRPDGLVKVLDFGIAKLADPAGERVSESAWVRTATGAVIGTTAYMSPEQARGEEVDARTDVFSLGVVLYEMLTRQPPFPGRTPTERLAAILEREPEPLGARRRGIPRECQAIVHRALAKKKEQRYARADDLEDDLRRLRATLVEERPFRFALPRPARGLLVSRRRAAAAVLTVVAAVAAGLYYFGPGTGGAAIDSLAVLPMANVGGDEDTEHLSDGITENLIENLSRLPNLKVMSHDSVFRYKGQAVDARAVGTTLGVRAVLTGRVQRRGENLSISVELVDTRDSSHIWGEKYDRRLASIFQVEEEIARAVTEGLRLRLSGEEKGRLARRQTDNAEAYQLYLKGRFYWYKSTRADSLKAREYFQQAIDLDPTYALAYSGLADVYGRMAALGEIPPDEGWPRHEAAVRRALELDPDSAEVHNSLAGLKLYYYRDLAGAESEFKRAVELNPSYVEAHMHYGSYLTLLGRYDEAAAQGQRALELDPLSSGISRRVGLQLFHQRRYDEAIQQFLRALELNSRDALAHELLGDAYEQRAMFAEAVAARRAAMLLSGDEELAAVLDRAYRESGFDEAVKAVSRKRLDRLSEKARRGEFVPAMHFVRLYVRLGDREQAFVGLERALEERTRFIFQIKVDPRYDSLRADPRFGRLLRLLNLD
jgi:TolB-like protein/Tfp pilus assembly protein PilF